MCALTDDLVEKMSAGNIVRELGIIIDGGGGGKPHLATAGGNNVGKLEEALEKGKKIIEKLIN